MSTYIPIIHTAERTVSETKFTLNARQIMDTALHTGDVQAVIKCGGEIIDSLTMLGLSGPIDPQWAQQNLDNWLETESDKRDRTIAARMEDAEPTHQLIQSKLECVSNLRLEYAADLRESSLGAIDQARMELLSADDFDSHETRQRWNTQILGIIENAQRSLRLATAYINEAAHHERMADELRAFLLSLPECSQIDPRALSQIRIEEDYYVDFMAQFLAKPQQGKYIFSPVAKPDLRIELYRCFTDTEPHDNSFGILNFSGDMNICPYVWAVRLKLPTAKAAGLL